MSFVKQNDLSNFLSKLKSVNTKNLQPRVLKKVADKAVAFAENEYAGTSIKVRKEISDNKISIIASGKGIAFIEFGTGITGLGTYPTENLPKSGIPITGSWVYYYPSEHKKVVNGKQGWFFGKTFTTGRMAGLQMYNTTKKITEYCKTELAKELRSGE